MTDPTDPRPGPAEPGAPAPGATTAPAGTPGPGPGHAPPPPGVPGGGGVPGEGEGGGTAAPGEAGAEAEGEAETGAGAEPEADEPGAEPEADEPGAEAGTEAGAEAETGAEPQAEAGAEPQAGDPGDREFAVDEAGGEAGAAGAETGEAGSPDAGTWTAPSTWAAPGTDPTPGAGDGESDGGSEGEGSEIEWQPVYDGDQISWQPVVAPEAGWPTADELVAQWEERPAPDYEAGAGADWGVPEPGGAPPGEATAGRAGGKGGGGRGDPAGRNRRVVVLLSVLTGLVVVIAITAWSLSNGITSTASSGPDPTTATTAAAPAAPTLPDSEFTTHRDELTGFTVKYPKSWRKVGTPVADVRLQVDGGGNEGMRIRVLPIETPATPANIGNYKAVTDGIAFANPDNKLVRSQLIQLNGRLAYYYLYTYRDSPTGQEGVHAHYFVFEGRRMFTMVLQSVPADDFRRFAGIFDQIAESFTVPEERFAPGATSTTVS